MQSVSFLKPEKEAKRLVASQLKLSVIVPAYNEAPILMENVCLVEKSVSQITDSYEIIIVEDGCSDGTAKIAAELSNRFAKVKHLHFDRRLGKGLALKRALRRARGRVVVFMDADLSTDLDHLHEVTKLVENGYDAVLGSRYVNGSLVKRRLLRDMASRVYNLLVNLLFWDGVSDHQCGFKGFSCHALKCVIDEVAENGFLFDTELIVRMKRKGLRLVEVPVRWMEPEDRISKINVIADGIKMGLKLVKLRLRLLTRKR